VAECLGAGDDEEAEEEESDEVGDAVLLADGAIPDGEEDEGEDEEVPGGAHGEG
jgi:hypothetical protein